MIKGTIISLDENYFSVEKTKQFLADHDFACKTMRSNDFISLFKKYDFVIIKNSNDVLYNIIDFIGRWEDDEKGAEIIDVIKSDSACLFCNIGNSVVVYKWTYKYNKLGGLEGRIVYEKKFGFRFEFKNNQLSHYGYCNSFR